MTNYMLKVAGVIVCEVFNFSELYGERDIIRTCVLGHTFLHLRGEFVKCYETSKSGNAKSGNAKSGL